MNFVKFVSIKNNMKILFILNLVFIFTICFLFDSLGQVNGQIKIGDQIWATSNLNVSKFQNGDPIFEAKTNAQWIKASEDKKPAWCYYQNNPQNGAVYGKLYNWYAVNDPRGLAPKEWHIPANEEWQELRDYLYTSTDGVCKSLKTKTGWKQYEYGGYEEGSDCEYCNGTGQRFSDLSFKYITCAVCGGSGGDRRYVKKRILSGNGTNKSGFAAKPGSNRFESGIFSKYIGEIAVWWSYTETNSNKAYNFYINNENSVSRKDDELGKGYGCSIRLIKDKSKELLEKERILEEEKMKKELIEKQLKEEKEKEKSLLEAQKKEAIIKQELANESELKRQDSLIARKKDIDDSLSLEIFIKSITDEPVVSKKLIISKNNWDGIAKDAILFKDKYLGEKWRIPTLNEMKNMISPPLLSKTVVDNLGVQPRFEKLFLCVDDNNKYIILEAEIKYTNCGNGVCETTNFREVKCYMNEEVSLRFVADR